MIDYSNVHPLHILLPQMEEQQSKSESKLTKETDVIFKEKKLTEQNVIEKSNEKNKDNIDEEEKEEGLIWLDEEVDNEQEPDHGILLGLEALCLLLTELKNTGTIKKRGDDEWMALMQSIPYYEKAIKPIIKVLQ
ncbi:hypothetical protein RFI_18226 [Reticulomyxa filosa]|uniref:Uncharacterized protein n=1 Tax=Reticulomyxa filosa TaxID=46433 RepID=X6MYX8_RETFI|nr:hypothetical protein RFI_18226 [Reticulomyxa filosa]|eukprot:ETO19011.1 hypothetical protein RFI_18226 [Reticulomyxa filosa]